MGEQTAISWTDHTFNSWWGCWKIADECKHCYADSLANVYAPGHWGRTAPRRFFGDKHWNEPLKWNRKALRDGVRRRVFVGSMMDWAEVHADAAINAQMNEARARLFALIRECPALDWLLLTKRPNDARQHLPWQGIQEPWPNVWLGVTCGSRASLPLVGSLRAIPAAVRFISCEPLLDGITADEWDVALHGIHWLIVGNESGPKRRPAEMEWVCVARNAAERHSVAFHFKQWVEPNGKKIHLPMLDGSQHAAFPEIR
jgi:protein gp37